MPQFHNLATTELEVVERVQVGLDTADWQTQRLGEKPNQADDADTDATLPQHLMAQVKLRTAPAPAVWTEAFDDLMLDNLEWLGRWHFDHLASVINAAAL
jgi:hypothetical protein